MLILRFWCSIKTMFPRWRFGIFSLPLYLTLCWSYAQHCTALRCTALHFTALHYAALAAPAALHYTTLQYKLYLERVTERVKQVRLLKVSWLNSSLSRVKVTFTAKINSSNQRLWVRSTPSPKYKYIYLYTLNDFSSWLSTSVYCLNQQFSSTTEVLRASEEVRCINYDLLIRCVTAPVSVDSQRRSKIARPRGR